MGKWVKKIVIVIVVAFILFFVISRPAQSAHVIEIFWQAIVNGFWAIYHFFASFGK